MKSTLAKELSKLPGFSKTRVDDLRLMKGKGLTHFHVDIGKSGYILRIPRTNQLDMRQNAYLQLQKACYDATSRSGHAPECLAVIDAGDALPNGAMVVGKIDGRKARLPGDMPAIARALAKIHAIRPGEDTAPLLKAGFPMQSQQVLLDAVFLDAHKRAPISDTARALIDTELTALRSYLGARQENKDLPIRLINGDGHPANYLLDDTGKAWSVDLEFTTYDNPLIDLADASLPITTQLDPDMTRVATRQERDAFKQAWKTEIAKTDPELLKDFDTHMKMAERLVTMRTVLWLCDWLSQDDPTFGNHLPPENVRRFRALANATLTGTGLADLFENDMQPDVTRRLDRQQHRRRKSGPAAPRS